MAANTKLVVSDLDFDTIKTNLINYMKSQNTFTSYDFTGSALNQIMGLLAYNTHYLSFYLNMVANEMYLDSAVLLPNIISHAKLMGYTPRSNTSSSALVNVAITKLNTDPTTALTMPAGTQFSSASLNGQSFTFITVDSLTVANVGNKFTFNNVPIFEGTLVNKSYLMDNVTNPDQIFPLNDSTVDTNTLVVMVQTSNTNITTNTYTLADDATKVTGTSDVYYLDTDSQGAYQIYFGDDIIGKSLSDGNIVYVGYISTNGQAANQIKTFALQSSLLAGSTSNVTTVVPSAGGTPAETGDSIKFSAPKSFLSQNRAVTVNDYVNMINKLYPFFQSVTVWGGEQMNPPVYGQVFISALPLNGFVVTQAQQQVLTQQIIQPISVLTVLPTFIQADEDFLNFHVTVYYNPTQTTKSANQIGAIVTSATQQWANTNLNTFNNSFRKSQLTSYLDGVDPSVTSSSVDVFVQKRFSPLANISSTYTLNVGNPLVVGTTQKNRLYSSPAFQQNDATNTQRDCYIEEVPQSSTGVESISIVNPGFGYTQTPALLIEGDGTGANAFAVIVNGKINNVVIDAPGSEYTSAQVIVQGGGGTGAVLQAFTQQTVGTLRSFFFSNTNVKTVLSSNVGTINYETGQIQLINFKPANVSSQTGILSIYAMPLNDNFSSNLNLILVNDSQDPSAIMVEVAIDTND